MKDNRIVITLRIILFVLGMILGLLYTRLPRASAETMYVNVSNESWLNGRESPSKNANVMCRFLKGDTVDVIEIDGCWAKVEEGGEAEYSYVSLDYLTASPDGETIMTVSSDGRVRTRSSPDGKVTGYVRDGDVVTVSFLFSGWAKTDRGWIDCGYLK